MNLINKENQIMKTLSLTLAILAFAGCRSANRSNSDAEMASVTNTDYKRFVFQDKTLKQELLKIRDCVADVQPHAILDRYLHPVETGLWEVSSVRNMSVAKRLDCERKFKAIPRVAIESVAEGEDENTGAQVWAWAIGRLQGGGYGVPQTPSGGTGGGGYGVPRTPGAPVGAPVGGTYKTN